LRNEQEARSHGFFTCFAAHRHELLVENSFRQTDQMYNDDTLILVSMKRFYNLGRDFQIVEHAFAQLKPLGKNIG